MLLLLSLASCGTPLTPPHCAKLMADQSIIERCGGGRTDGIWKDAEDCYPLTKRERMNGIVIVDFERSEIFLGEAQFTPDMRRYTEGTWLDWSRASAESQAPRAIKYGAYRIVFDGRRSACSKGAGTRNGYGHMSQYRDLAIVDDLISWKQVTQLPDAFSNSQ